MHPFLRQGHREHDVVVHILYEAGVAIVPWSLAFKFRLEFAFPCKKVQSLVYLVEAGSLAQDRSLSDGNHFIPEERDRHAFQPCKKRDQLLRDWRSVLSNLRTAYDHAFPTEWRYEDVANRSNLQEPGTCVAGWKLPNQSISDVHQGQR